MIWRVWSVGNIVHHCLGTRYGFAMLFVVGLNVQAGYLVGLASLYVQLHYTFVVGSIVNMGTCGADFFVRRAPLLQAKYELAKSTGKIALVTPDWLVECVRLRRRLPERDFALPTSRSEMKVFPTFERDVWSSIGLRDHLLG